MKEVRKIEQYCPKCGSCVHLEIDNDKVKIDWVILQERC